MRSINPCVVATPDGRIGVLTGRVGFDGCVEIRGSRFVVASVPLSVLHFYLPPGSVTASDPRYLAWRP